MASIKQRKRTFNLTDRTSVPTGRIGKHKAVVTQILADLEGLESGKALKIPLSELPDNKVNIRSALNRATRKSGMSVVTASDPKYLYVWNS
jgi:hypothetical protein